ncbi:hypothetical protein ACT024_10330 [Enterobacter mori]|uniref:hypothetical protein n=1 Tax=Enterobacter mori TaxID=539813 RepID=UPI00402A7034
MSTITKQWLQQKIADMEATRDDIPFGLGEDGDNTLAALRIALASLEAEPYGYVHKAAYEQAGSCGLSSDHEAYRDSSTHIAVYTAPPAPVSVPEPIKRNDADGWWMYKGRRVGGGCAEWYNLALDDCRAAMLQGADGNSPVVHDGWVTWDELQKRHYLGEGKPVMVFGSTSDFCSKHPQAKRVVHPYMCTASMPPQPCYYCPECEPDVAEWEAKWGNK